MKNNSINFEAAFRYMPGNCLLVKPDAPLYTILAVTEGMVNRSGLSAGQLMDKPFFEPFPANPANPDDPNHSGQNIVLASFEHVINHKEVHRLPIIRYDLANEDGTFSELYWTIYNKPVFDDNGNVIYILHTSEDITEKVKAQQREVIMKGIETMHKLFMQTPIAISILKGSDLVIELANDATLELWGKGNDVIGKPFVKLIPEVQGQGFIELLNEVRETGRPNHVYERPVTLIREGKKETLYINYVYHPYYEDHNVKAIGVLAIGNNVTEKVLAEKESEELRERFETMANNIPNLAWIADADGWIFWYNKRWYEYTGTTAKDMEGWGWKSVHDPDRLPAVLEEWEKSIASGQPFEMVFPLLGADKIFRPFLTRVLPVHDNKGNVVRWLGTNTDITKQKEVERMKDDFLSMASHELKTPVTTIKAYQHIAETMLENNGDERTLNILKKMGGQVGRLTTLIEDLLDISRIQQGKLIYNEEIFDFNELVKEVIDDMQKISRTHKIIYNALVKKKMLGDKNKFSQVLSNLITNAIKYSPNADKIIITTEIKSEGIQLSILDFGIGISKKDQPHIFEQFYRAGGESQTTFPGMGIGLYISSEIVKQQRGKIWVESTVGKGSAFYFWLPFDHRNTLN